MFNENYFKIIDTHEKAYILGLYYADGNLHKNTLQICLKDLELIEKIKKCFESDNKILNDRGYFRLAFTSKNWRPTLEAVGLTERKSLTLKFPSEEIISKKYQCSFMLGYFDGDGSVQRYKPQKCKNWKWSFSVISTKEFCEEYLRILTENCLDYYLKIAKYQRLPDKNISEVVVCGVHKNVCEKIYKFLYKEYKEGLLRKKRLFQLILDNHLISNKIPYKGVSRSGKSFTSRIKYTNTEKKTIVTHLGSFHTPEEAALAYNKKAEELNLQVNFNYVR